MTVIAWDGKTISADKLSTNVDLRSTVTKMFKREGVDGVMAMTGDYSAGLQMIDWYCDGADKDKYPAVQSTDNWARLIVATKDKVVIFETTSSPMEAEDKFHAWGSGRDYAMAAMEMGASTERAVEVAATHCITVGNGIQTIEL